MSLKMWFIPLVFVFFALSGCGSDDGDSVTFTELQITASENPIAVGFQSKLTATAFYSDGQSHTTDATWDSSNEGVATVDNAGLVTALTADEVTEVTIKATTHEGSGTFLLTVTPATLNAIELSPLTEEVPLGMNVTYEAIGVFSDGSKHNISNHPDLVWQSTNESVAIIVKGSPEEESARSDTLSVGTTTFTAVLGISSNGTNLIVNDYVLQNITITPEGVTLPLGVVQKFDAEGLFSDGITRNISADVKWNSASSENDVLTAVDAKGTFKGNNLGTANVSAIYNGDQSNNEEISSDNQALFIVEQKEITSFTVDSPNGEDTQPLGKEVQFIATSTFTDDQAYNVSSNKQVHWQSSAPSIATVTLSGLVKGVTLGNVRITASSAFESSMAHKDIEITAAEIESIVIKPVDGNLIITEGETQQYDASARYTDGKVDESIESNLDFSWSVTTSIEDNTPNDQAHPEVSITEQGVLTYDNIGDAPGSAFIGGNFMAIKEESTLSLPMAELIGVPSDSPLKEFIGVLTQNEAIHLSVGYSGLARESGSDEFQYVTMSYSEAVQYCDQLLYNGKDDWELPSSDDLVEFWQSVDGEGNVFVFSAGWAFELDYWSTTVSGNGHDTVSLVDATITQGEDEELYYASCVRSVQP
jgi:Bacterial Ig-like domain (group 2)